MNLNYAIFRSESIGLDENRRIAKEDGQVASNTRKDIENRLGGNSIN